MASSFHNHKQFDDSMEMSDHQMMTQSTNDADSMSHSSCCKTDCHCSESNCNVPALVTITSTQSTGVTSSNPVSFYAFEATSMHSVSLFRPPIFS
ncbi:MAG: hypothetical protein HRT93_01220 [Piscirickettsiaceae bacterium]|nr:hypothetical protein [Piscirickettsiaceae bacterium]